MKNENVVVEQTKVRNLKIGPYYLIIVKERSALSFEV